MYPITDISDAAIAKAQEILSGVANGDVRKDITSSSGGSAYNLQPVAMLLQPVITPWRNRIARVKNTRGGNSSEWRAIAALRSANTSATPSAEGAAGNRLSYSFTPKSAAFAELALGDRVTWAAEDAARGFEGDLRGRAVTNLLFALMMQEEVHIGFDRIDDLGTVSAPTVSATTGGTIADGTYTVKVRAIIGMGDGTNTRGKISASGTSTGALSTSNTNKIRAYTSWVEGAVGYEWYLNDGTNGDRLQATTGTNAVTLSTYSASTATAPSNNVASSLGMNGFISQLTAANGATVTTLATDTSTYTGTDFVLADIDAANKTAWDSAKASPEVIYMNSTQIARATNLVLAANGAPTLFVKAETDDMANVTGGYMLAKYVNKSTGRIQQVQVHPNLPDGTIMAYSGVIPFPTGGDMVGVDIEFSRDYQQVDYALSARRWDFEVFCREVLRVKFPGGAWVIRNAKSNATAS